MKFDLATLVRRVRNPRRSTIPIRQIKPTQALASDLYTRCYKAVIDAWLAAIPRILEAYSRGQSVRDGLIRDDALDLGSFFNSFGDELTRLFLNLTPELTNWAIQVEKWHRGQWRGAVLTATEIDLETMLLAGEQPQSVAETIAWNTGLIKDVSDQTRSRIGNLVFAAVQQRRPADDLAKEIREVVDMSKRRSLLIASDQTQKLSAALDSERMQEAGIDAWIWRHSHKKHPRKEHVARDGKRYTFEDPPKDMPGQLPYCGCRKEALLELD